MFNVCIKHMNRYWIVTKIMRFRNIISKKLNRRGALLGQNRSARAKLLGGNLTGVVGMANLAG